VVFLSVLGFGFRDLEEFVSFNELWSFSDIEMGDLTNIFNDDGEGRVIERIVTILILNATLKYKFFCKA
jgi:hypothetical protein